MNNRTNLWLLMMVTLLTISQVSAKRRPVIIQVKNFSCSNLAPLLLPILSCSSNEAKLSVRFSLTEALEQVTVVADFDIIKRDKSKMNIQHLQIDGCQYLSSTYKQKLHGGIFENVLKASNLPKACPIQARKVYELRNHTITLQTIPMALPALTFQIKLKVLRLKQQLGNVLVEIFASY